MKDIQIQNSKFNQKHIAVKITISSGTNGMLDLKETPFDPGHVNPFVDMFKELGADVRAIKVLS